MALKPGDTAQASTKASTSITLPSTTASGMLMVAAASGRWRLRRCARSLGRSSRSLNR
ncbi:hypothetical protein D9M69_707780 [compost metagenome]